MVKTDGVKESPFRTSCLGAPGSSQRSVLTGGRGFENQLSYSIMDVDENWHRYRECLPDINVSERYLQNRLFKIYSPLHFVEGLGSLKNAKEGFLNIDCISKCMLKGTTFLSFFHNTKCLDCHSLRYLRIRHL